MKQLKFNCKDILPALLNKSKTTSIEKGWMNRDLSESAHIRRTQLGINSEGYVVEKSCEYKVGEEVEIVWKKKGKWLCRKHCEPIIQTVRDYSPFPEDENFPSRPTDFIECSKGCKFVQVPDTRTICFNTLLGKAKITKVEKIEIFSSTNPLMIVRRIGKNHYEDRELEPIAKLEGFKSSEEMFKYLEEYVGSLEEPKPFYLITWEWIK